MAMGDPFRVALFFALPYKSHRPHPQLHMEINMRTFRTIIAFALLAFFATTASAKPKKHEFSATPQQVFDAAYKVARENHRVNFTDEKNLTFEFHTGTSLSSWGFDCNASVEPTKAGAILVINVQKTDGQLIAWGGGDRTAEKFFKMVTDELAAKSEK
jgi:hypothetical protein